MGTSAKRFVYKDFDEHVTRPYRIVLEGYPFRNMCNLSYLSKEQLDDLVDLLEAKPPKMKFRLLSDKEYNEWASAHPRKTKSKKRATVSPIDTDSSENVSTSQPTKKKKPRICSKDAIDDDNIEEAGGFIDDSFANHREPLAAMIPISNMSKGAFPSVSPSASVDWESQASSNPSGTSPIVPSNMEFQFPFPSHLSEAFDPLGALGINEDPFAIYPPSLNSVNLLSHANQLYSDTMQLDFPESIANQPPPSVLYANHTLDAL